MNPGQEKCEPRNHLHECLIQFGYGKRARWDGKCQGCGSSAPAGSWTWQRVSDNLWVSTCCNPFHRSTP